MKSKNITRIAMWSGPRNISTAMMRSFENRKDTIVIDEPFYAYYLKKSDVVHPGKDQILKSQSNNWHEVVEHITSELPDSATIYYQKHMAHHIFQNNDNKWVKNKDVRSLFMNGRHWKILFMILCNMHWVSLLI